MQIRNGFLRANSGSWVNLKTIESVRIRESGGVYSIKGCEIGSEFSWIISENYETAAEAQSDLDELFLGEKVDLTLGSDYQRYRIFDPL
jgi:hypothetical protein